MTKNHMLSKLAGVAVCCLLAVAAGAQTQTYTGTIKDLTGTPVASGQITFTLTPNKDVTAAGIARFTPLRVTCSINTAGSVVAQGGGACTVVPNTMLNPTGTAYRICVQPKFISPGSCFYDYALGGTKDISTVAPTLETGPVNYTGIPGPNGQKGDPGGMGPAGTTTMTGATGGFTVPLLLTAGQLQAFSADYIYPGTATASSPYRAPNQMNSAFSGSVNNGDTYIGLNTTMHIASGSGNLIGSETNLYCPFPGCDEQQEIQGPSSKLTTNSPGQVGGWNNNQIDCFGLGDCIGNATSSSWVGPSRGADEGGRPHRDRSQPTLLRWGGHIGTIDAADANGNLPVHIDDGGASVGGSLQAGSENAAPVINVTHKVPWGNITDLRKYAADTRFYQATSDSAIAPVSTFTTLTAQVDNYIYNGACPSTSTGVAYTNFPFAAGPSGTANNTAQYCFSVGSTSGMATGTVVAIAGNAANMETTKVITVVDGTHFIANAHRAHGNGEMVSYGGWAGWAGGFDADIVPANALQNPDRGPNYSKLYSTPMSMGCTSSTTCVFFIPVIEGGWNTVAYHNNSPTTVASLSAVVAGGDVASLNINDPGNYFTVNHNLGGQGLLAPPAITITGCITAPRFHATMDPFRIIATVKDAAGSGCPPVPTVTVQSTYANPFTIYPAAIMWRDVQVDGSGKVISSGIDPITNGGYAKLMPSVAGTFNVGDQVIQSTWMAQYTPGDQITKGRYLGYNSGLGGVFDAWAYFGQSNLNPLLQIYNFDSEPIFYGNAAQAVPFSADGAGNGYAIAPGVLSYSRAYAYFLTLHNVPQMQVGLPSRRQGDVIHMMCDQYPSPCNTGFVHPFNLFRLDGTVTNDVEQSLYITPVPVGAAAGTKSNWTIDLGSPTAQFIVNGTLTALHTSFPDLTASGGFNNSPLTVTSANSSNTAFSLQNTYGTPYSWATLLTAQGQANANALCLLNTTSGNGYLPQCLSSTSTTGALQYASGLSLQWNATNSAVDTTVDTTLGRSAAGVVSVGTAPGNASGQVSAAGYIAGGTAGVTVSGASCTIKAIVGGIITSATCP